MAKKKVSGDAVEEWARKANEEIQRAEKHNKSWVLDEARNRLPLRGKLSNYKQYPDGSFPSSFRKLNKLAGVTVGKDTVVVPGVKPMEGVEVKAKRPAKKGKR